MYLQSRRIYQYNEDDFRFKFSISNCMDAHKHKNKEMLSINNFSLLTCELVI